MIRVLGALALALIAGSSSTAAERLELTWPTPLTAWERGRPPGEILQHAGSGDPASGGFGGVRSGGAQFHEGVDIKPAARDRRGEPTDNVVAAMAGVVRHINARAGDSSYGRYIVLEHSGESPAVYTLYAHLARIAAGLKTGDAVGRGQVVGVMGHSSGGYTIPKDRSHLHFEVGLALTSDFDAWYRRQKFGSPNEHGMWNGMNLMGLDPLDLFSDWRSRRINSMHAFIARQPVAVRVRVATLRTPNFVRRYPALLTKLPPMGLVAGWEITFNWTGLPISWTPLGSAEVAGLPRERARVVAVDAALERRERSRTLAVSRRGEWAVGKDLQTVLDLLFGW